MFDKDKRFMREITGMSVADCCAAIEEFMLRKLKRYAKNNRLDVDFRVSLFPASEHSGGSRRNFFEMHVYADSRKTLESAEIYELELKYLGRFSTVPFAVDYENLARVLKDDWPMVTNTLFEWGKQNSRSVEEVIAERREREREELERAKFYEHDDSFAPLL
jgi:hypothetical protein